MRSFSALAAAALAPALARAHLFMNSPPPIPGSAPKDPLAGDGSNFPCHNVAFPGANGMSMPVGSSQLLSFDSGGGYNTAVHGGGSCQIAVTYETDRNKIRDPNNWYVILSIEGGCPTNSLANLDGSYTGPNGVGYSGSRQCNDTTTNGFDCVNQFQFNIPRGMKNGQATLAWTWFNTIGNREIYMNCAPIAISGGASDYSQMQSMPSLFVANLGAFSPGCGSSERTNVGFPNPGPVASRKLASSRNFVASATSQYPIRTPAGCPNNARAGVAEPVTTPATTAPSSVSDDDSTSTDEPDPSFAPSSVSVNPTPSPSPPLPTTDTTQRSVAPVPSPSSSKSSAASANPPAQTTTPARTTAVQTTTSRRTTTKKTTTKKATPTPKCITSHVNAVKKVKGRNAVSFCKKYKAPRGSTRSSVRGVPNAKALVNACKCVVNAAASTTAIRTTTPRTTPPSTTAAQAPTTTDSSDDGGNDGDNGDSPDPTGDAGSTPTSPTSPSENTCPAGSVPCSKYNDVVCPDSSHYGICDSNMCAVSQAVAPGTACENGQIVAASSSQKKRSVREHLARHIRRAHGRL